MVDLEFKAFETSGKENTEATLNIAKKNADTLGIKKIVIASTRGGTIQKAIEVFNPQEYELVAVTHNYGFKEGVEQEFPEDIRKELESKGVKIVSSTLAFSGVQSSITRMYNAWDISGMFARLVRTIIGDGVKVVMEIVLMATDSGALKVGEDVIALAGTGWGSDTCALIKASSTRMLEDLKVKAIFTKPFIARD